MWEDLIVPDSANEEIEPQQKGNQTPRTSRQMRQVGGPREGSRDSGRLPSLPDASPEPRGSISPPLLPPSPLLLLEAAAACCSCCWPLGPAAAAAAPPPPPPSSSTAMLAATLAGRESCTSLPSSDGTGCGLWPRSQEVKAALQPLPCALLLLASSAGSMLLLVTSPASARGEGGQAAALSACTPATDALGPRRRARKASALTLLL